MSTQRTDDQAQTMGQRLDKFMRERDISQADLAKTAGVKQQTISYLINSGAKSSSYAIRIATALGVNPAWLQEGVGNPHDPTVSVGHGSGVSVVRSHWVPLLKMNNEVANFLSTGEAPSDAKRVSVMFDIGERAFAMEVAGRSMEPELRGGDEVIVDPTVRPEPGDYVIAHLDGAFMLRKYRAVTATAYELVAANPDFAAVSSTTSDCRLVGTVMEHRRRLRA